MIIKLQTADPERLGKEKVSGGDARISLGRGTDYIRWVEQGQVETDRRDLVKGDFGAERAGIGDILGSSVKT